MVFICNDITITNFITAHIIIFWYCPSIYYITSSTKECVAVGMRPLCIFSANVQCWLRQGITNAMLRVLLRFIGSMVLNLPNTDINTEQNFYIRTYHFIKARCPYNVLNGKKIRKLLSLMWLYPLISGLGTRRLKMYQRTIGNILNVKHKR